MTPIITKDKVLEACKSGIKSISKFALESYVNKIDQVGGEAFADAIEIGIENTIAALYDANVDDNEILRVVSQHWGLSTSEIEDRLIHEKGQATIRSLKQHLRLQGYSSDEIVMFMRENEATLKIRSNKELWELRKMPAKLMKALQNNNDGGNK